MTALDSNTASSRFYFWRKWLPWVLVIATLLATILSVNTGSVTISFLDQWRLVFGANTEQQAQQALVLFEIRWPRAVLSLVAGATLGVTGACLQGLFRNPLADPSLIGISAGASLGAALAIALATSLNIPQIWLPALQMVAAFVAALATVLLVYKIAEADAQVGGRSVVSMLLAGIAITALVGAATSLLKFLIDDSRLRQISIWQMGSLQGQGWASVICTGCICMAGVIFLNRCHQPLNALLLGESESRSLGFDVARWKWRIVLVVTLTTAATVAVTGVIGFVGLLAPHSVRLLVGPNHRYLLPAASLAGALMLVCADIVSRILMPPLVLPVGIITAVVGAPLFLWLLVVSRGGYRWHQ